MNAGAIIIGSLGVVGAVTVSFLGRQLQSEFADWTDPGCRRMIESAIRRLPEGTRERYREEWMAHVNDTPGKIWKWRVAVGYARAARHISAEAQPILAGVKSVEVAGKMLGQAVSLLSATFKARKPFHVFLKGLGFGFDYDTIDLLKFLFRLSVDAVMLIMALFYLIRHFF